MRLLVSVRSVDEALAALDGGADIIDAKEPSRGALGAVGLDVFEAIIAAIGDERPISAALGDFRDGDVMELAAEFAARGAAFVKVGFAACCDPMVVRDALLRVVDATSCGVIAVAYADASRVDAIDADSLVRVAAEAGVRGMLVDTVDKNGPGLTALWALPRIAEWVRSVQSHGVMASVAGRLTRDDLALLSDLEADVVGVRGAACVGGRDGVVSATLVSLLRQPWALGRESTDSSLRSE